MPETVELARKLARVRLKDGKRSLREISAVLAEAGHTTKTGKPPLHGRLRGFGSTGAAHFLCELLNPFEA